MHIQLKDVSKKYVNSWLFTNVTFGFVRDTKYSILGYNGCGKSTLLQIISGFVSPEKGSVCFVDENEKLLPNSEIFNAISYCAPYISMNESFTLEEALLFHFSFKKMKGCGHVNDVLKILGLEKFKDKTLKHLSSGIKQKVKLGVAFISDTPILLLDEPCMNLDESNIQWYHSMLERFSENRIVIIASNNDAREIKDCAAELNLINYK